MLFSREPRLGVAGVLLALAFTAFGASCRLVELDDYRNFDEWYSDPGIGDSGIDSGGIQEVTSGLSDETVAGTVVNYSLLRTPVFALYDAARVVLIPFTSVYYAFAGSDEDG